MVNLLHRQIRANGGFGVSKVMTSTHDKKEDKVHGKPANKFEDVKLQALLDEDGSETQKQLAEQLGTSCFQSATRDGKDSEDR